VGVARNFDDLAKAGSFRVMDTKLVSLPNDEPFTGVERAPTLAPVLLDGHGRLRVELRAVAARRDPRAALVEATVKSVEAGHDAVQKGMAAALSDLAVTGSTTRARYRAMKPTEEDVARAAAAALGVPSDDAVVLRHAVRAVRRAHFVDVYLGKNAHGRARMRRDDPEMNRWVTAGLAVSGEDDLPAEPVNVSMSPLTQGRVVVGGVPTKRGTTLDVETRYAVAGPLDGTTDVILLIHGHTSRIEEVDDLVSQLRRVRDASGRPKHSVIVADLPNCGYAGRVDHTRIAPSGSGGRPVLTFLCAFLDALVRKLMTQHAGFTEVALVAGGSLGGNLSLMLGEERRPWLRRVGCWSPGSVWTRSHVTSGIGVATTVDRMRAREVERSRPEYFEQVFLSKVPLTGRTQPEHWYWDGWRGFEPMIAASQDDRRELYGREFRRFHWRVAAEQLWFSHFDDDIYRRIQVPVLLMAGTEDNFPLSEQRAMIVHLADRMAARGMKGWCRLPTRTGHSIHNERPRWLARTLSEFVEAHG
jgi:pimeloyl-ACP methyl ester carboxylesterase